MWRENVLQTLPHIWRENVLQTLPHIWQENVPTVCIIIINQEIEVILESFKKQLYTCLSKRNFKKLERQK
jgi:hypothetical protein